MENTPYLYDTLVQVLRQPQHWLDLRHLKTLAWMMVGLIHAGSISLCAWTPFVVSRAQYSQSTQRRFRRWLDNDKIEVHALYGPLRACFENHAELFARRRTMSRIIASFRSISLVCTFRS